MPDEVPIKGVTVRLGGKDYVVPPLTLNQYDRFLPRLLEARDSQDPATFIPLAREIALAALRRNYPELTTESVGDILDLGNVGEVAAAALQRTPLPTPAPAPADQPLKYVVPMMPGMPEVA